MINISKIADRIEEQAITSDKEKYVNIFQALYNNPFVRLGEIREVFDTVSTDDFKNLYDMLMKIKSHEGYEVEPLILGYRVESNVFRDSYWNNRSSNYYWNKLKNNKKTFI
ncbi:hypothetical protein ACOMCU_22550 [Lysinibacillus sp. UGB7]|uniref:hypothetical protein n=1 Tax=Lysinibacillus sp. UGB7 TaxID=3411039 RepID=UPI003B79DBBD